MRALLDTDIVFDVLCKRPYDEEGLLGMKVMHAFGDVDLWMSAKSYTDLFYLMRRELGTDGAHDLLIDTLNWASVCSVEEGDITAALEARWPDFEDSLANVCAEKVKADYLVTRDARGFDRSRIRHGGASAPSPASPNRARPSFRPLSAPRANPKSGITSPASDRVTISDRPSVQPNIARKEK